MNNVHSIIPLFLWLLGAVWIVIAFSFQCWADKKRYEIIDHLERMSREVQR